MKKNKKYYINEFRYGIKETSKYVFSHHKKEDYFKCYLIKYKKYKIHICSRCLGIYLGILIGFLINYIFLINYLILYFIVLVFPLFTLINWSLTAFKISKSTNYSRLIFGLFLGISYSFGFFLFLLDYRAIYVFLLYIIISAILIKIKQKYYNY